MHYVRRLFGGMVILLLSLVGVVGSVGAQGGDSLVLGQPLAADISTAGQSVRFAYPLTEPRAVTIQALSQSAQPTLTLLRGSEVIAQQPNLEGALSISLIAFLPADSYAVEVGAANGTTGSVIVLVQNELSILPITLSTTSPIQSVVSAQSPLAVYTFGALPEPAYLYVDSLAQAEGLGVRVRNLTSGRVSADYGPDLLGARVTLPAGDAQYQLEITHGGPTVEHPFSVCLTAVSANTCAPGTVQPVPPAQPTQPPAPAVCSVTPSQGGANIRQTASVNSPVLLVLPGGAFAPVFGVAPDASWFQVAYLNATGWIAASVVTVSGDCAAVPVVNPPAPPPVQPTQPPVQPTAVPMPTMPPATAAPSGPCVVTFSAPEYVYTRPVAQIDWLYDQVPAMGEIILVGRYNADPSWYKSNYAGAWWLNAMGTSGTMTGDCASLPLVSWP